MGNLYSELHQVLHNSLEVKGYEHYLPNFAKKALYFIWVIFSLQSPILLMQ